MPKVTLDMNTFKALASDTRLDILRALDGKKMSLKDISKATKLNKATLHEHLTKLNEAGLVKKKEREGHKWVYYKLSWKGEGLLHPENTRIVVLFSTTFVTLFFAVIMIVNYVKGYVIGKAVNFVGYDSTLLYEAKSKGIGEIVTLNEKIDYSQAPIANVPLTNQTADTLSLNFLQNSGNSKGILGNSLSPENVDWEPLTDGIAGLHSYSFDDVVRNSGDTLKEGSTDGITSVSSQFIAIVHDPALQYIAIGCIVIFSILLTIGIWRLRKNKRSTI